MSIGLFLLFWQLGTLNIQELMTKAHAQWAVGSGLAVASALLLLGGAVGKSGQLPLQVWLPDAMAGPTPVSALIHAATMVTAGVYLIARTHVLFEIAPAARIVVALVGVLTLLIAGFAAMAQRDIKRVLAYSTISQIGYMFLALGVGAWSAAIFHLVTHAFFKALLFMAAGAIIVSLHHEQDMFRMGGLWKKLPLVFVTFLVGAASLASLPLVTAGFYSKDFILWNVWNCPDGGKILWLGAWIGAFFTATYTFRMIFLTFFGEEHGHVHSKPGWAMNVSLVLLATGATFVGFLEMPRTIHELPLFSEFMEESFPTVFAAHGSVGAELAMQIAAQVLVLSGLALAYVLFLRRRDIVQRWVETPRGAAIQRFCLGGCGFDDLYRFLFIRPFEYITRINKDDIVDSVYNGIAAASVAGHFALSGTQTGRLRWYMMGIAAGAAFAIAWVVFL
jgi:NADH-quinone oxidoreductase subunit L